MLYIPKIDDYLRIFTDLEVKDFVAINVSEYIKSIREEQNTSNATKSFYIFLMKPDEVEKYVPPNYSNNRFWIFFIQNYSLSTLNQWLKTN